MSPSCSSRVDLATIHTSCGIYNGVTCFLSKSKKINDRDKRLLIEIQSHSIITWRYKYLNWKSIKYTTRVWVLVPLATICLLCTLSIHIHRLFFIFILLLFLLYCCCSKKDLLGNFFSVCHFFFFRLHLLVLIFEFE